MRKVPFLFLTILIACNVFAQYKNDNVLYKTVYTQDLCKELQLQTGYILLDVRSSGEYADTSMMGMNIGRFKDAMNIDVRELSARINELNAYKKKPVFVYCSHSQRSRKASKMLADSGFINVININGGMTGIRQLPRTGNACVFDKLVTQNAYRFISPVDLCEKLSSPAKNIFLLDVRSDSAYMHNSLDARDNAYGYFKNSTHISLENLEPEINKVPENKEIIIVDLYGDDAEKAAVLLKAKNFKNISILLEGIDRLLNTGTMSMKCMQANYISPVKYGIMSAIELKGFIDTARDYLFIDMRRPEEFANKYKDFWRNIGHLNGAVNIPVADMDKRWNTIADYRNKPVILYDFSSSTIVHDAANILIKNGFTAVHVLQGGLFNIGWTAANIKGYQSLAKLRVDVPVERQ